VDGVMNRRVIVVALVLLVLFAIIVGGILWIHLGGNEGSAGKLYTFPLSVEGQTYVVSIRSNYSNAPEVSYFGLLKSVQVFFKGERENAFCNITIPNNLIWSELSVYQKGYKMSGADYIQSSNNTHNSVYFTFDLPAFTKDFSVKGTEGVETVP
jgi:hypothetical protein